MLIQDGNTNGPIHKYTIMEQPKLPRDLGLMVMDS